MKTNFLSNENDLINNEVENAGIPLLLEGSVNLRQDEHSLAHIVRQGSTRAGTNYVRASFFRLFFFLPSVYFSFPYPTGTEHCGTERIVVTPL